MTPQPSQATRTSVESSSVVSVGYATEERALEVEFRSGAIYRYFDVPSTLYIDFMAAPSKGTFFNRVIRNRFGFSRV